MSVIIWVVYYDDVIRICIKLVWKVYRIVKNVTNKFYYITVLV